MASDPPLLVFDEAAGDGVEDEDSDEDEADRIEEAVELLDAALAEDTECPSAAARRWLLGW